MSLDDDLARVRPRNDPVQARALTSRLLRNLAGVNVDAPTIGRYSVLSSVGEGAHGIVYAAYDPQLDRRVALKLLRRTTDDRDRLVREARALARVSHPNVVTVHEVGEADGEVFVAMEFIEGPTLVAWLLRPRLTPSEILAVLLQAGVGLSAAHAQGIVHRDFKPSNVMVGSDGRVRVTDFGLASGCAPADTDRGTPAAGGDSERRGTDENPTIAGTPAYMAPEQHSHGQATFLSDQYSYCLTAWESLTGRHPFRRLRADEDDPALSPRASILRAKLAGPGAWPSGAPRVPSGIINALARGLHPDPDKRWPTMHELLDRLEVPQRRRWRSRIISMLAGSAVTAAVASSFVLPAYQASRRKEACAAQSDAIDEIWNDTSKELLRSGLAASGAPNAQGIAARVTPWIDLAAQSWREHAALVCMNASEQTWDLPKVARAQWCLHERRSEIATLVGELAEADKVVALRAVNVAAALSPVRNCVDETSLASQPEPPPEHTRPKIIAIGNELRRSGHLLHAGKYDRALTIVVHARRQAEAVGWAPLWADARQREAALLAQTGAHAEAEVVGTDAYMVAARTENWGVAADAATDLAVVVGHHQARYSEGLAWAEHAAVAIAHAGDPLGLREARRLNSMGSIEYPMGQFDVAVQHFEQALQTYERALGPNHPGTAHALNNLGVLLDEAGAYEQASAAHVRALSIRTEVLGPGHPSVAESLNNLGALHHRMGALAEAKQAFQAALLIRERVFGPEHENVGYTLSNLADVQFLLGDYPSATEKAERALAILEAALGPKHPAVAVTAAMLGNIYMQTRAFEKALPLFERAYAIRRDTLDPGHPDLALSLTHLGNLRGAMGQHQTALTLHGQALELQREFFGYQHLAVAESLIRVARQRHGLGETAEAKTILEESLAVLDKVVPPDHPMVGIGLTALGRVLVDLGEHHVAAERLERALQIRASLRPVASELAETQFVLATAVWAAPPQANDRACDLISKARSVCVDDDPQWEDLCSEIATWAEAHAPCAAQPDALPRAIADLEPATVAGREAGRDGQAQSASRGNTD